MSTERLERTIGVARGVLEKVDHDQLGNETPCATWDVRGVVNHLVGNAHWSAATLATGEPTPTPEEDFAGGDIVGSYDEGTRKMVAAFREPGALQREITFPFGSIPVESLLVFATMDQYIHAWDIANGIGQDTDLDPELGEELLDLARANIPDEFRGEEGEAQFGPVVDVPASAPVADRLAGFLGRTP